MTGASARRLVAAALVLAAVSGCAATPNGTGSGTVEVVATTTVLADLAANVGGSRVAVHALVPPGGEVHTFDPSPSDVMKLTGARVILRNGLGLDDWLAGLISDSGSAAPVVALAEDLDGVDYRPGEEEGATDPHLWLNVRYASLYVQRIADELSRIDPEGAALYAANAERYRAELARLDQETRDEFASIPADGRRLVSFHDAFYYFADAYGLQIVGTVVDAPGQDPSAGQVAALIDEIRDAGVRAILAEAQFPTDLAERIAEETGITVVHDLFSDSVGPAPYDTYTAMLRSDTERISAALR